MAALTHVALIKQLTKLIVETADELPYEERMAARAAMYPEIVSAFAAAEDGQSLQKAKRVWYKKLDNDEVQNSAALYGLIDWLYEQQKAALVSRFGQSVMQRVPKQRSASDARIDSILRMRDSTGRARARK